MPHPQVSVLLTTHGSPHLAAAIDSVLAQRLVELELLVVDDASTDGTGGLLAAIADPRLRVLRTPTRGGVVAARTLGFASVRTELVAMLDHDDLCHPDRLTLQLRTMRADPRLLLCGSAVLIAGRGRPTLGHAGAAGPALLRWMLHLGNPLAWSSVMLRAPAVRALGPLVRAEHELADDLDLYHRLLGLDGGPGTGRAVRLGEALVTYRWHAANTSHARRDALTAAATRVLARAGATLLGEDPQDPAALARAALLVRHVSDREPAPDAATLRQLGAQIERLLAAFLAAPGLEPAERAAVRAQAASTWWEAVRTASQAGRPGLLRLRGAFPTLRGPGWFGAPPAALGVALAAGSLRALGPRRG